MGKIDIVLQKTLTDYNSRIAERFKSLKKLIPGKIGDLSDIVLDNPTEGQVLTYSGGRWVNADAKGGGGVSGDFVTLNTTQTITGAKTFLGETNALGINSTTDNVYIKFYCRNLEKTTIGYYNGLSCLANQKTYARIGVADDGNPEYWPHFTTGIRHTLLHTGNYDSYAVPKAGGTITGDLTVQSTLTTVSHLVAGSTQTYRLYAGGGAEYVWFDCRNSSGTMVSAFQLYPSRLNISVPITFNGMGGGFYMQDATWIRTYGGKSFYHDTGTMRTDGVFQVGNNGSRFVVTEEGYVGIGKTNPSECLHLKPNGNIRMDGISDSRYALYHQSGIYFYANPNGGWSVGLQMFTHGGVHLGGIAGAFGGGDNLNYFYYGGTYDAPFFTILPNKTGKFYGYCDFTAGAGNSGSDMRFKTRIMPVPPVLDDIKDLEIFSYLWQKEGETAKDTFGLNANQLLSKGGIYAKMVHVRPDAEKTQWVEYERAGLLALKGVQELYGKLLEKGVIEA